jgi:uncharacterized protein YggL (DUF469 family)
MFYQELIFLYHGINHQVNEENRTHYLEHMMSRNLGSNQVEIHGSIDSNASKLAVRVSCAHKCIIVGIGAMLA